MRLTLTTALALWLLVGVPAAGQVPPDPTAAADGSAGSAAAGPSPPAPFVTRQSELEIPFSVRPGSTPETQPTTVRVFVSWDRGKTWHFYDERRPEEGRFRFRPRQDGEFWFATQTIDRSGRPDNADPRSPQLRLVIDTQRPQLLVQASADASANVSVSWNAVDANLAASTLKIEYQDAEGTGGPWQAVELPAIRQTSSQQHSGQATFHPAVASRAINLRAEVADAAGNIAYFSQRLSLATAKAKSDTQLAYAPAPDPSATRWPTENPHVGGSSASGSQLASDATPKAPPAGEAVQLPALVNNPFVGPGRMASVTSQRPAEPLPEPRTEPPAATWQASRSPQVGSAPSIDPQSVRETPAYRDEPRAYLPPEPAIDNLPLPPGGGAAGSVPPSLDFPQIGAAGPVDVIPPPQPVEPVEPTTAFRPRLTNSRRFSLEYDLQTVGPEGVAAVELWGTTDGGRTWVKWGADPDRASPFDVEVNGEASYGFRIVVVAKNGLATHAPQPGEPADIWVGVDLTRPAARLTAAAYGQGEAAGKLDIRWQASDEHLGSRPVTLAVGERPDGPFSIIAAGLPNSGQYYWEYDPRSPRNLYLRLEVRDEAGNIAIDQLSEPIKVEGLEPKGRIRGISPGPEGPQGTARH